MLKASFVPVLPPGGGQFRQRRGGAARRWIEGLMQLDARLETQALHVGVLQYLITAIGERLTRLEAKIGAQSRTRYYFGASIGGRDTPP